MKDEIKDTQEWQALNAIWKKLGVAERKDLEHEFRVLSEYIRKEKQRKWKPRREQGKESGDDYGYLNDLTSEAKQFVIDLVEQGEPNLYHSFMAIIENKKSKGRPYGKDEILEFYFEKYGKKRPYLTEKPQLVESVLDLCLMRKARK